MTPKRSGFFLYDRKNFNDMEQRKIVSAELRIANWIHDGYNEIRINGDAIAHLYQAERPFSKSIPPPWKAIAITDEWLKRADMSTGDVFWANFSQDSGGYFIWIGGYKVYLEFVHQMQNLYFLLTKEELNFKP